MKMKNHLRNLFAVAGAIAVTMLATPSSARAATLEGDLVCALNNLNTNPCVAGSSFGTIKLDDGIGGGQLTLSVDLVGTGQKFKEVMLAYDGAATSVSSVAAGFSLGTFSIPPYTGTFEIGDAGGNDGASWILSADVALSLNDFANAFDSQNKIQFAIHIQDIGSASGGDCDGSGEKDPCVPGQTGEGSLKIGGTWGPGQTDIPDIPEPSTMLLMGGSLLGLAWWRNRRS